MRALLAIAGFIFGGVPGAALSLKFGSWIEGEMTDEELRDFHWICDRFELPVPQNPEAPSEEWKERVDQCIADLPEEEREEMRQKVREIISEPVS